MQQLQMLVTILDSAGSLFQQKIQISAIHDEKKLSKLCIYVRKMILFNFSVCIFYVPVVWM